MNRRGFLKWVGVGAAAVVVAPKALLKAGEVIPSEAAPVVERVWLQYGDYVNFSSFVISSAIDESVSNTAKQLSEAAWQEQLQLQRTLLGGDFE